jgi:hypothetical protein
VPAIELATLVASILPYVENPWPETIGLELPFAMAGAGGVLASLSHIEAAQVDRDRAISHGGLRGFRLGAAFYVLSLLNQIVLGI